jgi:hypothetical protein
MLENAKRKMSVYKLLFVAQSINDTHKIEIFL